MRKFAITIICLCHIVASHAQTEVLTGITQGKEYGVAYNLPQTRIDVLVTVNKVCYTPGEFCKYADHYLRLQNISATAQEYWEVKSVSVKSVGVPNSAASYFIKLKDKTVAPLVELTQNGLIKSINVPYQRVQEAPESNTTASITALPNPREFLTQEILMASSTAKMAELTAKEIYDIRESKNALLRGQADNMPQDGTQLRIMLDNLNLQEEAMTRMFSGTYSQEEQTYTFSVMPQGEIENEVVFRFSKLLGVLSKEDLAGEPYYISLKDLKTSQPTQDDGKKKKDLEGVAYNVPGQAEISLTTGNKTLYKGELPVTQFGTVEYLAPILFNKSSTIKVYFDPNTGGLLKVDRNDN